MTDLSHWDFAENFSGYDVAALILGIEPRDSSDEQWRVRVITDRMELHYKFAITRIFHEILGNPFENVLSKQPSQIELASVKLQDLYHRYFHFDEDAPLEIWLADPWRSRFADQEFQRQTVSSWLAAIGMGSIYRFNLKQEIGDTVKVGNWPWGKHNTELLGHLEAAAKEFWVNYDPANAKATAPKNETVIKWLVTERKVSETVATSMATMLRPDGLKTGPRK